MEAIADNALQFKLGQETTSWQRQECVDETELRSCRCTQHWIHDALAPLNCRQTEKQSVSDVSDKTTRWRYKLRTFLDSFHIALIFISHWVSLSSQCMPWIPSKHDAWTGASTGTSASRVQRVHACTATASTSLGN